MLWGTNKHNDKMASFNAKYKHAFEIDFGWKNPSFLPRWKTALRVAQNHEVTVRQSMHCHNVNVNEVQ
jgi:hypothetical protein